MSEGTRSPSQVIQSDNRPQKPLLWVGPENAERRRLAGSAAGGCGNGWEGLLVLSFDDGRRNRRGVDGHARVALGLAAQCWYTGTQFRDEWMGDWGTEHGRAWAPLFCVYQLSLSSNREAGIKPGRRFLVPSSISPGGNVELPSDYMRLPECDARPGDGGLLDSRPVSSQEGR